MFGYVTTNMEEMKVKDYRKYRAFYCGICQDLKEYHGQPSRLTLTYDMTFLAILLTGLYESAPVSEQHLCGLHPLKKHLCYRNELTAYAADMNVLLSYYNLLDDWIDEKKPVPLALARTLRKDVKRLRNRYPRQAKAICSYLKKPRACEFEKSPDWIGLPVIREICWERFLSGRKISGQGRFGRLDFSWGNLFI